MVAATSGLLARKVGFPAIVGYLLTGLLVSPFTPGFVADSKQISILADIGVVLLLFEVGIEIDLRRVKKEHGAILWAAPLQVLVGTIFGTLVFIWMNLPLYGAALLALSIALSSSVVIVKEPQEDYQCCHRRSASWVERCSRYFWRDNSGFCNRTFWKRRQESHCLSS
jgi:CPA2 family monovalent cation:H+ antiporter-2